MNIDTEATQDDSLLCEVGAIVSDFFSEDEGVTSTEDTDEEHGDRVRAKKRKGSKLKDLTPKKRGRKKKSGTVLTLTKPKNREYTTLKVLYLLLFSFLMFYFLFLLILVCFEFTQSYQWLGVTGEGSEQRYRYSKPSEAAESFWTNVEAAAKQRGWNVSLESDCWCIKVPPKDVKQQRHLYISEC
jgi:hypothetical protein